MKLSVVSYLTNSIVDQILQELYATHKTLVSERNDDSPLLWADRGELKRALRCLRLGRCPT